MAVDKTLPNIKEQPEETTDDLAIEMEEQLREQAETPEGEIDIMETEDGGAEINFDPSAMMQSQATDFNANLADFVEDSELNMMGSQLFSNYQDYKNSRKDWEKTYTQGLDLLGFKYENRTEPFSGASGATHPVLAEAATQFQALAYKELLPANGPVRTQVVGLQTPEKTQQANRVKDFMNYQIMDQMKEYEPEFDQMLFYLPLAGSAFKKVYYDDLLQRAVSKFVPAEDLVVPYTATSLDDAESIIHKIKMSENELRKQQVAGFYRDIELKPGQDNLSDLEKKEMDLEGRSKSGKEEDVFTLLECHVNLDLEGFEDVNPQTGEPTGIKIPYIVTLEENSREVLSIRRNYDPQDPLKKKISYFVHFKFLPGLGFMVLV